MYCPLLVLAYQKIASESFADFRDGERMCSLSETCHFAVLQKSAQADFVEQNPLLNSICGRERDRVMPRGARKLG